MSIPLIDISTLRNGGARDRQAVSERFSHACRDIGFAVVTGHGIPADTINSLRSHVVNLFARPIEEKLAVKVKKENYRGYIPFGFFTPNATGDADAYEGYKLHCETDAADAICSECSLYGPNRWPVAADALRQSVTTYWQYCDEVVTCLLDALARAINIDPQVFRQAFEKPLTNMTLLHYPSQAPDVMGFGIHPHKDTDALTILAPDPIGGLQVRRHGERNWINVVAPDDALVVNIGDMLESWSGGYFVSTPHRVINTSGSERYSFPYFAVPRYDVDVSPLVPPQPGFEAIDSSAGDVSRAIWYSNWPDAMAIDPQLDPALYSKPNTVTNEG